MPVNCTRLLASPLGGNSVQLSTTWDPITCSVDCTEHCVIYSRTHRTSQKRNEALENIRDPPKHSLYKNYMYGSTCWRWTHATLEFMTVVCLPRGRGGGRVILAGCQWRVIMGKALDSLPTTLSSFHVILVIGIWKLTLRIICH